MPHARANSLGTVLTIFCDQISELSAHIADLKFSYFALDPCGWWGEFQQRLGKFPKIIFSEIVPIANVERIGTPR